MHFLLLKDEVQEFIKAKTHEKLDSLAFKKNPFPEIEWKEILTQIESRKKAEKKLPIWFYASDILYPSKINLEQTSSEITASYKSNLIEGHSLIDLTGGFGVDDYEFSKKFLKVIHCESNQTLSTIVKHNFKQLGVTNIQCQTGDSSEILEKTEQKFDWIYIDPSRRNNLKQKIFLLKDCSPNVPELLDFYFEYSDNILVKTSPLLDLSSGINELKNVAEIHIVATDNEVKELLWILKKNYSEKIKIKAVNITDKQTDSFEFNYDSEAETLFGLPDIYLYEPNAAMMKSGGFSEIGKQLNLKKLHKHTHLYTSNELVNFYGRVFEIQEKILFTKQNLKTFIKDKQANISVRNFPETVEILRKKWNIRDGGNQFVFFTTDLENNKIILFCKKINI